MAEAVSVEFESPSGDRLRFDWPLGRLLALEAAEEDTAWERAGELDWDEIDLVRVLSARFDDGRALALAAIRPTGAEGHGEEAVFGVLVSEGEAESLSEVLLSTEQGPDGAVRRVGLELYRGEDGLPIRVAGDVTRASSHVDGGVERQRYGLSLRAGGSGVGVLDVLRQA
jgi:hypothetical protein